MIVGLAFVSNALFNFLVALLVARFLGPAEFGRFAIAWAGAVLINTAGFDWLRLSAVRFYSQRVRRDEPAGAGDAGGLLCRHGDDRRARRR